jgi:hypothetical protein
MNYICLKKDEYKKGRYSIVPLRKKDIFFIKDIRNDQMELLRQNDIITDNMQEKYFTNFVEPSFTNLKPSMILFSYLENNNCIGYGGLTNIDWHSQRAEVSFLVDRKRYECKETYIDDFRNFIEMLKEVAFKQLKFNRLFTETFSFRNRHIDLLENTGFKCEGRMKKHVCISNEYFDSMLHGCLNV